MKKHIFILILSILLTTTASANEANSTNLDWLNIQFDDNCLTYNDGSKEYLMNDFTLLFINGSIIKNSNILIKNNRSLIPVRIIAENLNCKVDWDNQNRVVTITEYNNIIKLKIDSNFAEINEKQVDLDIPTKIYNNYTYIPLRFITEALNADIQYFDDKDDKANGRYLPFIKQIIIDKYHDGLETLSQNEAKEILKKQLILAYENIYKEKFIPYDSVSNNELNEKENWRKFITSRITISSENSRFYIFPIVWDFWVDKYTGDVFVFYRGANYMIYKFNPYNENAFAFAG